MHERSYKGEKEFTVCKRFTVYKAYREKLLSIHTFVTEDFTLEVIWYISMNKSSSKILF